MENPNSIDLQSYENNQSVTQQQTAEVNHNHPSGDQISQSAREFVVDNGKRALLADDEDDNLLVVDTYPSSNIPRGLRAMQIQSGIGRLPAAEEPAITLVKFNRYPLPGILCTTCHRVCTTTINETYQSSAWAWCCILCCFAGLLCAATPFLRQDMKKTVHSCPYCSSVIGIYAPKMSGETLASLIIALIIGMSLSAFAVYYIFSNHIH